jgi:hypothetical protein
MDEPVNYSLKKYTKWIAIPEKGCIFAPALAT